MSKLEETLNLQMRAVKIQFEREYRFHDTRKWRFDFAMPDIKLAVEVEGGLYINGRHNRGKGYEDDLEKYGEAMKLGWTVYRCGPRMIKNGQALETIEKLIELQGKDNVPNHE